MQIIHAAFKIRIVSNLMLPKPALPDAGFTSRDSRCAQSRVVPEFWQGFAAQLLNYVPTQAELGVMFGQCPNGVKMVRQQHPGINGERMVTSGAGHCLAQGSTKHRLEQDRLALMRDNGEKKCSARGLGTAVIGHGSSIGFWGVDVRCGRFTGSVCFQIFSNSDRIRNAFKHRISAILTQISSIKNIVGCALERTASNPTNLERTTAFNLRMFAFFQAASYPGQVQS
jgi:hypothetical protein